MTEEWMQWKPIEGLSAKYYIDSVVDMINNFKIILSDSKSEEKMIEVIFCEGVDAYTQVNESFRVKLVHDLREKYGQSFYGDWTFFKVNNSRYLKWLSEESYEWSDVIRFTHFSFIAADSVLDVITNYEPEVRMISKAKI